MLNLTLQYSGHWMQRATHWKRPWCWEWLKMGGEGGDRGWDGWMASPTRWTWVWARSGRWWRTGKPGVLQSMGSQRVRHSWATELNWLMFLETCLIPLDCPVCWLMIIYHLYILEKWLKSFAHFKIDLFVFSCWVVGLLIYSRYQSFFSYMYCQYFFSQPGLPFLYLSGHAAWCLGS